MAISQKLHTKLVQKLILTPSLQQAIKLLPMSTLELRDLLTQEMVENPMLEEVPVEDTQAAEQQTTEEKPEAKPEAQKTDSWDDADYQYFFGEYLDDGYRPKAPQEVRELPPIENTLSTSSSLADHLLWQLSLQSDDATTARDRRSHHRQPQRRRVPRRLARRAGGHGALAARSGRARPAPACRASIR